MSSRSEPAPARPDLPGGLVSTRRAVRRLGGPVAVVVAGATWIIAAILDRIVPGAIGGAGSFVLRVMAAPFLPIFGIPVATDSWRLVAAMAASAVMWWFLGAAAGRRVTAKVVAGWREWTMETATLAAGAWLGALAAFGIAALLVGVV